MFRHQTIIRVVLAAFFSLISFLTIAQETIHEEEQEVSKHISHGWYTSPWVWIIGSILFILLLIALIRVSEKRG
jgi:cytochrome bd-type quinol oxidase subunit 2